MKRFIVLLAVFAIVFSTIVFFLSRKTEAATASDLAGAFEATGAVASLYTGNDAASSVMTKFGNITPRRNSTFAVLSSGYARETNVDVDYDPTAGPGDPAGAVGDSSTLALAFTVPAGMNSLLFDFYFISEEYPEYVGSAYNDDFKVIIAGSSKVANGTNIAKDPDGHVIDVNSVTFAVGQGSYDLQNTDFDTDGGTGWVIAGAPVAAGDNITLTFNVEDVGDGILASTVLLDNFRFDQGIYLAGVQSGYFFSQSQVNITDCGQATLDLYSAVVVRGATTVDIGNSNPNILSLSTNQLTIPAYQSKASNNLTMQGLKNGSTTLTASGAGLGLGTTTVNVSGCPVTPETGANKFNLIQFVNYSLDL